MVRSWLVYVGGAFNIFDFHPYLGKIPILTSIFQLGSNNQLGKCWWLSKFKADLPSLDPFSQRGFLNILSGKLRYPLKINGWKMFFLLKQSLFRGNALILGGCKAL